jgi:hypothetical protein
MFPHRPTRIRKLIPFAILLAYVLWIPTPLLAQSAATKASNSSDVKIELNGAGL